MDTPHAPLTPLGARTPLAHPALYGIIGVLSLVIVVGAAWVFWPKSDGAPVVSPSPTASASSTASPSSAARSQRLDCVILDGVDGVSTGDTFRKRHAWFQEFQDQIIQGWDLNSVCYNPNTNQATYLKYQERPSSAYVDVQLGVYSIVTDTFDKGPVFGPDIIYGNCGYSDDLLPTWEDDTITFGCRGGDAGYGMQTTYTFDTRTKEQRLIRKCPISEDAPPCVEVNERISSAPPWKEVIAAGVSLTQPSTWPKPTQQNIAMPPLLDDMDSSEYFAALGPIGPWLEGSNDSPYHIAVYAPLPYDRVLSAIKKREFPAGDYMNIRTGNLNGMRAISYDVGGLCVGPEAILFGARKTAVISSYCVDEVKDLFDSIVPTVRITP